MKANSALLFLLIGLLASTAFVDGWLFRSSGSSRSSSGSSRSSSGSSKSSSGSSSGSSKSSNGGLKGFFNKVATGVKNTFNKVTTGVKNTVNKVKDTVKNGVEYVKDFVGGASDMWRNYKDMKNAYKDMDAAGVKDQTGTDKYFHAKANYEAANRGTGGRHAAALISNIREGLQLLKPGSSYDDKKADYAADQEANRHGRNGGDPDKYRPEGLPDKYKK